MMSSGKGKQKPGAAYSSNASSSSQQVILPSFLFLVNELPINDDPDNGGVIPRTDEWGKWLPPLYSDGFGNQRPGTIFRWQNGVVTLAEGCQWWNDKGWSPKNIPLVPYRITTMFFCNPWIQYLTASGDASTRNIEGSDFPDGCWWPLTFEHDRKGLSRVNEGGEHASLAGTGASWIKDLGLDTYKDRHRHAPKAAGLSGNLPTIIALMALTCQEGEFPDVLVNQRAWRDFRWKGHDREDGQIEQRGVVATVYYDPENPLGSTGDILYALEWTAGRLV